MNQFPDSRANGITKREMAAQEREQAFLGALEALQQQYGVQLISTLVYRQYGQMLQVEPGQVQVLLQKDWRIPADQPREQEFEPISGN